jgi:hypothetical protein
MTGCGKMLHWARDFSWLSPGASAGVSADGTVRSGTRETVIEPWEAKELGFKNNINMLVK